MAFPEATATPGVSLYAGYGLTIESDLPCPELVPGHGVSDIRVSVGPVPAISGVPPGPPFRFHPRDGALVLDIPDVARFSVRDGADVIVDSAAGAAASIVRAYLQSSVLPAVLHQRGWLTLHASGIETPEGAVLFVAPSGAGKSTLLATLLDRGFVMMCDDVAAISGGDAAPLVQPGLPYLRLWDDALAHLGRQTTALHRVVRGVDKYAVPEPARASARSSRVRAIYVLDDGPEVAFSDIDGAMRFETLQVHNRTRPRIQNEPLRPVHFSLSARVAAGTRMRRVRRPHGLAWVGQLADRLVEDLSL